MLLKVKCEYCGNEELVETDVIGTYYCNVCDDEIEFGELEIEVIKDIKENLRMSEELKELKIGDKVFWNDEKEGLIIKARNESYLIAANDEEYSIIDLKEGVCSTNDYVFNPYDYKNQDDIDKSLRDLENGKYELSRRNKAEISKVIVSYERS